MPGAAAHRPERRAVFRNAMRGLAGALLGGAALWLVLRDVQWGAVRAVLAGVDAGLCALAVLSIFVTLGMLALRWQLLFYPEHRERSWRALLAGIVVSQMLNILSPVRLFVGEVVRVYAAGHSEGLSKLRVLGTLGAEKAADLAAFSISLLLLAGTLPPPVLELLPGWLRRASLGIVAFTLVLVAAVVGPPLWRWLERRAFFLPQSWAAWVGESVRATLAGLAALRHAGMALAIAGISLLVLVLSMGTNYLLLKAFGFPLGWSAALLILVWHQVGDALPALPAKMGMHQLLTVTALSLLGIDWNAATGYAIVLYVVALGPKLLLGGVILAAGNWMPLLRAEYASARAALRA
ncbi:MAG: UPF0104 family protein [Chloroflexi bacterium]|nr:MAG: UPF0104 family protein [Chloroflexota bacterium]